MIKWHADVMYMDRPNYLSLTFPLVGLIAVEEARSLGLLGEEEADDEDVQHRQPEHQGRKVSEMIMGTILCAKHGQKYDSRYD